METRKPYIVKNVKQNIGIVFGVTTINHKIRLQLGISNDEYVFLDFLRYVQSKRKERITWIKLWKMTGVDPTDLPPLWRSLKEKGLVYRHESGVVTTSQKWDDMFSSKVNFDEFWALFPKGNKESAKEMYSRAVRVKDHKSLCEAYKQYIAWCDETNTFKKNTSSWLNPKFKYWEDNLTIAKKEENGAKQATTLEEEW